MDDHIKREFTNVYDRINEVDKLSKDNEKNLNRLEKDQLRHEAENAKTEIYVKETYKKVEGIDNGVTNLTNTLTQMAIDLAVNSANDKNAEKNTENLKKETEEISKDFKYWGREVLKYIIPFAIAWLLAKQGGAP